MPNIISAGNATNNGTSVSSDASGELVFKTGAGAGANAITIDASQNVTLAAALSVTGAATLPTIKSSAASTPPTIQDSAGTQIGTFCRAWVNFDGTGTFSPNPSTTKIRASFNVTSITDNGTGDYTVNFTTTMPDANYAAQVWAATAGSTNIFIATQSSTTVPTTSALRFVTRNAAATVTDLDYVQVAIFR